MILRPRPARAGLSSAALLAALMVPAAAQALPSFHTVALTGQEAPGTGGARFESFFEPVLSASGALAFLAALDGVGGGEADAVLRQDAGGLGLVARAGEAAPGTGGASFTTFRSVAIDAAGRVAFAAGLNTPSPLVGSNEVAYREGAAGLRLVARSGDPTPEGSGSRFREAFSVSAIGAEDTAFGARVTPLGSESGEPTAVFVERSGIASLVLRSFDPAPGVAGETLGQVVGFGASETGEVAVRAELSGAPGSTLAGPAIFRDAGGGAALLVRTGDPAPGIAGATLSSITNLAMGPDGTLAFTAQLAGAGLGGGDLALFREGPGGFELAAQKGDAAPGAGGAVFESFEDVAVNGAGEVAFVSTLAGEGIGARAPRGALYREAGGILDPVLRAGGLLEVAPGDVRTVSGLTLTTRGFGAGGEVLFGASFTDGSSGVFLASFEAAAGEAAASEAAVPLPAPVLLLGAAVAGLGAMRRRGARGR